MAPPAEPPNAFRLLDPILQDFLRDEGFERPTAAQEAAIPVILEGGHTLLIAPTGMGKTESAVLPVFSGIIRHKRSRDAAEETGNDARRRAAGLSSGATSSRRISVVYVTPLRALNRDLMNRLHDWGKSLGLDVRVRHGDTTQSERNRQSRNPPDFLITTPETLQIMFTGPRLREALAGVKAVVIDEVHELAEGERGAQLAVALERLEDLVESKGGRPFQRVGLSATVGDEEEVAKFLGGASARVAREPAGGNTREPPGARRTVTVVKIPVAKNLDLRVLSPAPTPRDARTAEKLMCRPEAAAYLNACLDLIERHTSTLLFVNTRETAEVLAARIRMLDEEFPIVVHHGSLARDVRVTAEEAFRSGRARGLICTSSMELGIDVGSADLVIQYSSPRQVTRLVQRVGRAGHRHDLVSNGVVVGQDPDDIFEAYVVAKRTLRERIEPFEGPRNPLDVLANQLAAIALESGSASARETFELFRRTHAFGDLSWEDFEATLKQLSDHWVVWSEDSRFGAKRRTREYLRENVSMIRDEKTYRVVNMVTRRAVATLDEGFVAAFIEPSASFICQGQPWRVVDVDTDHDDIYVEPVKDPLGAVPSWIGEEIPVPFEVAQDVGRERALVHEWVMTEGEEGAASRLVEGGLIDRDGARKLVRYVEEQGAYALPTHETLTLDFSPSACVLNICCGSQVNETLGRILASLLTARLGQSVGLQVDPYRVVLSLPGRVPRNVVEEVLRGIDPATVPALLELLLGGSAYMRHRMLGVARKFGALARDVDYKRVNVARLLDLFKGTPLHREALREVFHEKLDVEGTERVLRQLRDGRLRLVVQDLSPIAAAGLDQRVELISPARADRTLLEALRTRLMNERVVMLCMNERDWKAETRVSRATKMRQCPKCGSVLLAATRPWNEGGLRAWGKKDGKLNDDERKDLARLRTSANLVFDHGEKALLALVARGVGPDTAGRLLHRQQEEDEQFLRDILEAEVTYAKTRQFWD